MLPRPKFPDCRSQKLNGMADARLNANRVVGTLVERAPICHWFLNRAHRFHFVAGDSSVIFHHSPSELAGQPVSMIDGTWGSWSARLEQAFSGETLTEQIGSPTTGHTLIHVPLLAEDRSVLYVSGFAYAAGQRVPAQTELGISALLILRTFEAERARAGRFLHDVVAQILSSIGLQTELLRLETVGRGPDLKERTAEMQFMLEDTLKRVRKFISDEEESGAA